MTILSHLAPSPVDAPPGPPDAPPVEDPPPLDAPPPIAEPPPVEEPPRPDGSPLIRVRRQRTTGERIGVSDRSDAGGRQPPSDGPRALYATDPERFGAVAFHSLIAYPTLGTLFKGRDEALAQLRRQLRQTPAGHATVIVGRAAHGLGGVGKTGGRSNTLGGAVPGPPPTSSPPSTPGAVRRPRPQPT